MRKWLLTLLACVFMLFNALCASAEIKFDLVGEIGGDLSDFRINAITPFVQTEDKREPFYTDSSIISPVFRVKLDEGDGNTVTELVSGRELEIVGDDYEWINDADIRVGSLATPAVKQKSALRLNNSYINVGEIEALESIDDGFTIAFWTNFEVFGRNDSYEEPYYHQYTEVKTYGSYKTAYKYDADRNNVIFQSDNTKMCLVNNKWKFDGMSDTATNFGGALANNNYYNMYIIVVKKDDAGTWGCKIYGNDKSIANSSTLSGWDGTKSPFEGNICIGTSNEAEGYGSMELGIADLMVFDKPLTYKERLELFYEYRQSGYYLDTVPEE